MSKNVIIQEGGTPFNFSADELRTAQVGEGNVLWVPKDEVRLTTKHITKDGTYKASSDGYYGYSEVSVSGIGKAVGKDGGGNDAIAETDPTTGDLVITELPSTIVLETLPTKIAYIDGEAITLTGAVVKAYKNDGTLWTATGYPNGIIPLNEVYLPVSTADIDAALEKRYESADGQINAVTCTCNTPGKSYASYQQYYYGGNIGSNGRWITGVTTLTVPGTVMVTQYDGHPFAMSLSGSGLAITFGGLDSNGWALRQGGFAANPAPVDVFGDRQGDWLAVFADVYDFSGLPVSSILPTGVRLSDMVLTGGEQIIPVQWNRPGDGKMLGTQYMISVASE